MPLETIVNVSANTRPAEQQINQLTGKNYAINLNINSQPLGRITGQLSEFNKSIDAANARVIAFGASAGAISILEKSFHALIDSTIEVQKAMNGIQVILGASEGVMTKFGKNLFDIAKNTGQSFDVVAEAATNLSRQGLGVEETLKRTNDALVLSRITGMGAAESVRALTAAVNSFTSQAVTATEVVNKFATVDSSFAIGAKDLPEAISRVGSAAAQAGVSLDELIALVTSAQVATARGGSVIGNSFKTIFTRLERGKTQDLLESIGVSTKDSEGKLKSTIDMLKDLATVYGSLSQGQQANVAEKVGGVFQINILKAALADLGKENSVYNAALKTSISSTDEATKRNEKLNETYAAQINRLKQSATELAANAGKQVFGPSMDRIIGGGNNILDSLNNIDSNSIGAKLGKGILDGIGQVLAGPGLVLIGGVVIKLLGDLAKFSSGSVKELLGLNAATKQREDIQKSVLEILQKEPDILAKINAAGKDTTSSAKILLSFLEKQTAQMEMQAKWAGEVAGKLYGGGVRMGGSVPVTKKSAGYIPEFASEEMQAKMLGAKNPRATWSDGTIGGKKFIKNSEEHEIVGYGRNGDSAVIPMYANGYVPNFAANRLRVQALSEWNRFNLIDDTGRIVEASRTSKDLRQNYRNILSQEELVKLKQPEPLIKRDRPINSIEDIAVSGRGGNKVVDLGNLDLSSLDSSIANKYGIFFPNLGGSDLSISQPVSDISGLKNKNIKGAVSAKLKTASIFPLSSKEGDFDKILEELFLGPFANLAGRIASTFASKDNKFPIAKADVDSAFTASVKGSIFEKALGAASAKSDAVFKNSNKSDQDPFDYAPLSDYPPLINKIGLSDSGAAEAKRSKDAAHNLPSKILTHDSGLLVKLQNKIKEKLEPKIKTAATGYIPNFADALHASIAREIGAGAPAGDIYVKKYGQLTNANNPDGYGVFNKRDEGTMSSEMRAMRKKGYAHGYIPNFADDGGGFGAAGGASAALDLLFLIQTIKNTSQASKEAAAAEKETLSATDKLKEVFSSILSPIKSAADGFSEFQDKLKTAGSNKQTIKNLDKEIAQAKENRDKSFSRVGRGEGTTQYAGEMIEKYSSLVKQRGELVSQSGGLLGQSKFLGSGINKGIGAAISGGQKFLSANGSALGIAAPLIAGQISELIPKENAGAKQAVSSLGNVASMASTGAMLGGPYGAVAGAAIGAIGEIPNIARAFNSSLPKLTEEADKAKDGFTQFHSTSQSYLQSLQTLEDAVNNGTASESELRKMKQQVSQAYAKFSPDDLKVIKEARQTGGAKGEREAIQDLDQRKKEDAEKKASSLALTKNAEDLRYSFSGFLGTGVGAKDTSKVSDMAVSVLTQGLTGKEKYDKLKGVNVGGLLEAGNKKDASAVQGQLMAAGYSEQEAKAEVANLKASKDFSAATAELAEKLVKAKAATLAQMKAEDEIIEVRDRERDMTMQNVGIIQEEIAALKVSVKAKFEAERARLKTEERKQGSATDMEGVRSQGSINVAAAIAGEESPDVIAMKKAKLYSDAELTLQNQIATLKRTTQGNEFNYQENIANSRINETGNQTKAAKNARPYETNVGEALKNGLEGIFKPVDLTKGGQESAIKKMSENALINITNAISGTSKNAGTAAMFQQSSLLVSEMDKPAQITQKGEQAAKSEALNREIQELNETAKDQKKILDERLHFEELAASIKSLQSSFGGGNAFVSGKDVTGDLISQFLQGSALKKPIDTTRSLIRNGLELKSAGIDVNKPLSEQKTNAGSLSQAAELGRNYYKTNRSLKDIFGGEISGGPGDKFQKTMEVGRQADLMRQYKDLETAAKTGTPEQKEAFSRYSQSFMSKTGKSNMTDAFGYKAQLEASMETGHLTDEQKVVADKFGYNKGGKAVTDLLGYNYKEVAPIFDKQGKRDTVAEQKKSDEINQGINNVLGKDFKLNAVGKDENVVALDASLKIQTAILQEVQKIGGTFKGENASSSSGGSGGAGGMSVNVNVNGAAGGGQGGIRDELQQAIQTAIDGVMQAFGDRFQKTEYKANTGNNPPPSTSNQSDIANVYANQRR